MSSSWHRKKEKLRLEAQARAERDRVDEDDLVKDQTRDAAMGGGDDELYERKLTKEEKKAAAKAAREAKRKAKAKKNKKGGGGDDDENDDDGARATETARAALERARLLTASGDEGRSSVASNDASDRLAEEGTICTFSTSTKGVDPRSRDINVQNFTLQHKGMVMLDECEIMLNHGNRYGLIGRNGCGKSTFMKALGARAVPIPDGIDIFHLKEEIEASTTVSALEAVMSVDEETRRLEAEVENLNNALAALTDDDAGNAAAGDDDDGNAKTVEEQQEEISDLLSYLYERLDALDADTAEKRARSILKGLGFTHAMMDKKTADFSGGWRMRVSLARALFIQPVLLLLDEPTNHLDMEAVIWLEDYLSRWNRILLLISHSQDFLNNVCTHSIHFTNRRKLITYDGNYDQFVKTKGEKEENQMKQYKWEQEQIKSMKEYIARFGHGTSKNAKQAQSKEKVLEKMVRAGLTAKPEVEKPMNFAFPDPGTLPPPVLAFHDVSFGYPKCQPLYTNVNFGVDLDSRIALVGPNGAGKTTLVKLMCGELLPTLGDIRPHGHLKMGRFTQHFIDVLDLTVTPLEFFEREYSSDSRQELRGYLGRFGVSGRMQVQTMSELSDGQKSRVVFAKLGRDAPHILLLDEPTNHLDMESIDSLASAIQKFDGGLVLVSHDMRLISQVAKEIWICDDKRITPYKGDILNFKMDMRNQMGLNKECELKGDASVAVDAARPKKEKKKSAAVVDLGSSTSAAKKTAPSRIKVVPKVAPPPPPVATKKRSDPSDALWGSDDEDQTTATNTTASSSLSSLSRDGAKSTTGASSVGGRYVPPHLRNRG